MAATVDDLSYDKHDPEQDDRLVREQLEKHVLTKGAWSTIMYKFREIDRKTDDWGKAKAAVVRYRKRSGEYKFHNAFTISSEAQAKEISKVLTEWFGKG